METLYPGTDWSCMGSCRGRFHCSYSRHEKEERIIENLGAVDVELTEEEYAVLNKELGKLTIHGTRDGRDIKKMGTIPDSTIK